MKPYLPLENSICEVIPIKSHETEDNNTLVVVVALSRNMQAVSRTEIGCREADKHSRAKA